jgi:hypothetical protein
MRAQPAWRFYAPCRSGPILDLTFPPAGSTRAPCSPRYSCRQFRPVLEISKCGPSGTSPRTLPRGTGCSNPLPSSGESKPNLTFGAHFREPIAWIGVSLSVKLPALEHVERGLADPTDHVLLEGVSWSSGQISSLPRRSAVVRLQRRDLDDIVCPLDRALSDPHPRLRNRDDDGLRTGRVDPGAVILRR